MSVTRTVHRGLEWRRFGPIEVTTAMSSISSIATSGMQAALLQLGTAAHNVANSQTNGFHRQEVHLGTHPAGGVVASVDRASMRGHDLATDTVSRMSALCLFKANLLSLRTEQQMLGSLLDATA
jgi:hypothetical protein